MRPCAKVERTMALQNVGHSDRCLMRSIMVAKPFPSWRNKIQAACRHISHNSPVSRVHVAVIRKTLTKKHFSPWRRQDLS